MFKKAIEFALNNKTYWLVPLFLFLALFLLILLADEGDLVLPFKYR